MRNAALAAAVPYPCKAAQISHNGQRILFFKPKNPQSVLVFNLLKMDTIEKKTKEKKNMHNDLSAGCAHDGETGNDDTAQMLTKKQQQKSPSYPAATSSSEPWPLDLQSSTLPNCSQNPRGSRNTVPA